MVFIWIGCRRYIREFNANTSSSIQIMCTNKKKNRGDNPARVCEVNEKMEKA